jgi:predicted nucleic acid-binding protein
VTPTPVARGLLDTSVVLDYREGWPAPVQCCQDPADLTAVRVFLGISIVHPVTAKIVRRAFRILDSLTPPAALTPDDAIVAATAIEHILPLYTLDPARYATVPGLTALRPY